MTSKTFKGVASVFDQPPLQANVSGTGESPKSAKPSKAGHAKAEVTKKEVAATAKRRLGQAPPNKEKVTFYLDQKKMRALRHLALDLDMSYSDLVEVSIADTLKNHKITVT
jgi:hypothetical protein